MQLSVMGAASEVIVLWCCRLWWQQLVECVMRTIKSWPRCARPMNASCKWVGLFIGSVRVLWTNVELVSLPFQFISAHHCCDVTAHLSVVGLIATAAFDTCPTFWIYRPFWRIHRVTATRFCPISMPADFCRHLVGENWYMFVTTTWFLPRSM